MCVCGGEGCGGRGSGGGGGGTANIQPPLVLTAATLVQRTRATEILNIVKWDSKTSCFLHVSTLRI